MTDKGGGNTSLNRSMRDFDRSLNGDKEKLAADQALLNQSKKMREEEIEEGDDFFVAAGKFLTSYAFFYLS